MFYAIPALEYCSPLDLLREHAHAHSHSRTMPTLQRPAKRTKLLSDASSEDESEDEPRGIKMKGVNERAVTNDFQVNEDYARRFERNKKREEMGRLEEKYGKSSHGDEEEEEEEEDEDSEDDVTEDDDAELATRDVDREISETLRAIKVKDPRVYDANVRFYRDFEGEEGEVGGEVKEKEKPMFLRDYHRRNLMDGYAGGLDEEGEEEGVERLPRTYQDEQDDVRRELVGSIHAIASNPNTADTSDEASDEEDDDFLVAKKKSQPRHETLPTTTTTTTARPVKITSTDIATADKDPETYLSNFMAARAWLPPQNPTSTSTSASRWQAFDSDDSDEEKRADAFEEAYNLRFEDPATSRETLRSFARDTGKFRSVRREELGGRKRKREREREVRDAVRGEREGERRRLRRLRVEEVEGKVRRIREAGGLRGKDLDLEEWRGVLEGEFDAGVWEAEMERRFGEGYYEAGEGSEDEDKDENDGGEVQDGGKKRKRKRKLKKPKWEDEIEIRDLVPDFEREDKKITLSSAEENEDEDEGEGEGEAPALIASDDDNAETQLPRTKPKTKKDRAKAKAETKRLARKQRRQIESLVDSSLPLTNIPTPSGSGSGSGFKYRETSPTTFGLSARDILFADDQRLNEFVGLRKLGAWREGGKKRKERGKLGGRGGVGGWRRRVFGTGGGLNGGVEKVGESGKGEGRGQDRDKDKGLVVGDGKGEVRGEGRDRERKKKQKKREGREKQKGKMGEGSVEA